MLKSCETCEQKFEALYESVNRKQRFCSRKCAGASLKMANITKACVHCGTMVTYDPAKRPNFKYCNHKCFMEAHNGILYGVVVHGKASSTHYDTPYWKRQASRARSRDNYTCQDCGQVFLKGSGRLQVHHIIPVRLQGTDNLSNLISLCPSCHRKADCKLQMSQDKCIRCGKTLNIFNGSGHCGDCYSFSPQHLANLRTKRKEQSTGPRVIIGKTLYKCATCATEFYRQRTRMKGEAHYCGRKCYQVARKDLKQSCTCLSCGFEFTPQSSSNKKYCSPKCYHDERWGR